MAGRPSKLTPELQGRICDYVREGNPHIYAAGAAGIGYTTFKVWMRRGKSSADEDAPFRSFRASVKKAGAEAVAARVKAIREAEADHWQAAAWWLERRCPEHFGSHRREIAQIRKELNQLMKARQTGRPALAAGT